LNNQDFTLISNAVSDNIISFGLKSAVSTGTRIACGLPLRPEAPKGKITAVLFGLGLRPGAKCPVKTHTILAEWLHRRNKGWEVIYV
jgi:hypothetical protein